jgi:OOP family OmpA-OmpF porin
MKKTFRAVGLALLVSGSFAAQPAVAGDGYLVDSSGQIVRSGTGLCWTLGSSSHTNSLCEQPEAARAKLSMPAVKPAEVAPAPVAKPVASKKVTLQSDALFDFNKATLKTESKKKIDHDIAPVLSNGIQHIEGAVVTGHTDSVGTTSYNKRLGQRRAEAVKSYLISKGAPADKVKAHSAGEAHPVASNKTATGRAKNRRVEVEFSIHSK